MRRLLPVLVGLVVVIGGGWLLLTVVHGRDAAGVGTAGGAAASGPGTLEPDRGDTVRAGAGVGSRTVPAPTSGAHARRTATQEGRLDDAELLTALALGDVAFVYGSASPPAGLAQVQEAVAGPFDPELAAAGQAVILVRRPGVSGVQGLAWRRRLEAAGPSDPQLRAFADTWLGRGAGASG